ncbi:hypothetical protein FRB90_002450 [Tulasnella sp. 427]|nr:hypothetical protein FRB90_002450 [Tulasnella sp. 427]
MAKQPVLQESNLDLAGEKGETPKSHRVDPEVEAAVQTVSVLVKERLSLEPSITDGQLQPTILALESVQDRIESLQREMTLRIAELKRYKNNVEVPLHLLPPEIFLEILSASVDWPNWNVGVNHALAQVCKHWWHAVTTVSWFWPEIDVVHGKETTEMILRRNQTGPLVVRCTADGGGYADRVEFMTLAAQHASRWKSLIFKGRLTDELFALLETPAPMMSELFIYPYNGPDQRLFHLGDGAPLRHLDCDFCSLPWDSDRLSKLRSIQLRNLTCDLPSIPQLRGILEASPQLQWLLLASWSDESQTAGSPTTEASKGKQVAGPQDPFHLPSLETLVLQNIPRAINNYLLTHIEAPSCTCIIAGIRPSSVLPLPTPHNAFVNLLAPAIKAAQEVTMAYEEATGTFRISSTPEPVVSNDWIHWVKRKPGINFLFHTERSPEAGSTLRQALSGMNLSKAVSLNLIGDGTNPVPEPDAPPNQANTSSFPVEALQALPQVRQLSTTRNFRVGEVLEYLSQENGEGWTLPNLTTLSLSKWRPTTEAQAMLDEIINFGVLRQGALDEREDDWGGELPARLEKLVLPPEVAELFKRSGATFEGMEVQKLR